MKVPRLEKELEELQRLAAAERKVERKTIPEAPTRVLRSVAERRRLEAEAKRPDNIDIKEILASMDATMKKMKEKEFKHVEDEHKHTWDGKPISMPFFRLGEKNHDKVDVYLPRKRFNITAEVIYKTDEGLNRAPLNPSIFDLSDKKKYPSTMIGEIFQDLVQTGIGADGNTPESRVDEVWLERIKIREITDGKLAARKLRAGGMMYPHKLLGDVSAINVNPGQCVIDYIIAEFHNKGMRLTRPDLIEQLGGVDEVKDGVSTDMLYNWADRKRNISMYALDPFGKVFLALRATGTVTCCWCSS